MLSQNSPLPSDLVLDIEIDNKINHYINKFVDDGYNVINKLYDENFAKISKTLKLFETKDIYIKRAHVLNQVTKYLTENEMTPAICYVFSSDQIV